MKTKAPDVPQGNHAELPPLTPDQVAVASGRADAREGRRGLSADRDARWRFVQAKTPPRGLWQALAQGRGKGLASVVGRRKDRVFLQLHTLLEPLGLTRDDTEGWGAYARHSDANKPQVGQDNPQKSESKHRKLRTRSKRLVRRTRCFSKTEQRHDLVIGLFMNPYACGRPL